MNAPAEIDIDTLRGWIGRTETTRDAVTCELVARFLATLDAVSVRLEPDDPAPLGIHWCLAPAVAPTSRLGPDGHPARGGFLPPVPLPRRMWAGGELVFERPLRIGETVRRTSRIEDVALKQGRSGPLCFVTMRHDIEADGAVAIRERQDIVYRGMDANPAPSAPPPEAETWRRDVEASPVLLFRYSALTFNGHRIHYDRRYCLETEGYPGLVVHGPLQATLLLHLAAELRDGTTPARFTFRGVAPAFDGVLKLNASETDAGLRLWTSDADGRRCMEAEAQW
jgi:3-methylfumaryl-CoA hydratase